MMLRTAHKSFKPGHYPYSLDSHDLGGFFLEAGYIILINLIKGFILEVFLEIEQ